VPDAAPTAPATEEEPSKLQAAVRDVWEWLIGLLLSPFAELGALSRLFGETLFWGVRPPYRGRLFVESMEFIGVGSIFIVSLTALFVGGVLALQLVDGFRDFGAENQTGAVIGLALAREVGPVFAALMVTSRAGSAMTTELGSMRVTNQIDALVTMAVNPVQYLVVPRVVAGFVMVPVLTMLFNVVGVFGAFFVAVSLLGLDPGVFMDRLRWLVDWSDVSQGLIKAMVFGVAVTLIACRHGFYAQGGAAGVGRATNRAVVQSAIAILMLDYLVTSLILGEGFF
jgi:phospholipid/cholesterol/gamma-HCH transport system permease protein